jgi:flagellar biosynthesis regulator FlbT
MTEPKPNWIGGAKDGRFSCAAMPLTMNSEPLSSKQLHEFIVSQSMTIDATLTRNGELVDALKRVQKLLQEGKFYEAWIEINKVLG